MDKRDRTFILIVAGPTTHEAYKVARAAGVDLPNRCIRPVRKAYDLRGWSRGTPVLAGSRDHRGATGEGQGLSLALDAYLSRGTLRIAQAEDIARANQEGV